MCTKWVRLAGQRRRWVHVQKYGTRLRAVLMSIGWRPPAVVDVDWSLDYLVHVSRVPHPNTQCVVDIEFTRRRRAQTTLYNNAHVGRLQRH
jgi:hypothetical protein